MSGKESGRKGKIHEITFEDLKAKGITGRSAAPLIIDDPISEARLGKGAGAGAQDTRASWATDRDDAGTAKIQPDETETRGGADEKFGRSHGPSDSTHRGENMSFATGRVVEIDYTNWRKERRYRRILPHTMRFGSTEWYPRPQWLLSATDLEDGQIKEFAFEWIHEWDEAADQTLPWRKPAPAPAPQRHVKYPDECHQSHVTRVSDASSFDEICTICGATDIAGGGWGRLRFPCPGRSK